LNGENENGSGPGFAENVGKGLRRGRLGNREEGIGVEEGGRGCGGGIEVRRMIEVWFLGDVWGRWGRRGVMCGLSRNGRDVAKGSTEKGIGIWGGFCGRSQGRNGFWSGEKLEERGNKVGIHGFT
jgi:hypothetical protein